MTMPNFLVIGAQKTGTTALHRYLDEHPRVYMSPVKETNFFALEGEELDFRGPRNREVLEGSENVASVTDIKVYRRLFEAVSDEAAIGEASPLYLYSPKAAERIRHYVPEAKLVAVLRNPVERAYSCYLMMLACGRETITDFSRALKEEERRIQDKWEHAWHYKRMGFYYPQMRRYFDTFDRDQIQVHLHEDLDADTPGILRKLFRFIGVVHTFVPNVSVRHNVSGVPKEGTPSTGPGERSFLTPPLTPEVRSVLASEYREDILRLQDLVERDLSEWLG